MSIAALFTITRIWKQPKYPSTEEWIKKMWNIHTIEYYSDHKKKTNKHKIVPFAEIWMDLETVIQNGVRKRKTNITY